MDDQAKQVWKDYIEAGHDMEALLENLGGKCSKCGVEMIDLSEDLSYGDMRKCVDKNLR